MRALKPSEIRGSWGAIMLPIALGDEIDFDLLAAQIDALLDAGVSGVYSNGTACEFFSQSEDEFSRVSELLARKCESRGTAFQLGASCVNPREQLRRIDIARELNPGAIQVILPDWFPVTDDEAVRYLSAAAERARGVGLVLYNPPHAKRRLAPAELDMLTSRVDGLIGMKLSGGDAAWYEAMRPVLSRASVFVPGHKLATGVKLGAHGSYSNIACLSPARAQAWYALMLSDMPRALAIEAELQAFIARVAGEYITQKRYSDFAFDKFMAASGGWAEITPRLRFPYSSIPEADAAALRARLPELVPEFWRLIPD